MLKKNGRNFNKLPASEMVMLIKQNDAATLKRLYITNFPKVMRYVIKNSGDEQQAKDVYQEAFLAMWRNIKYDKFTDDGYNLDGYLFKIAKYKWLDLLRSANFKKTIYINRDIEINEDEVESDENKIQRIKLVMDCFENLGARCQTLLKLFYFERKPYKEIAQLLAIDEASARNAKYRCQEQLKKMTQTIPDGT